ncbi:putative paraflagellar rod component par4 [Diplonema papillatum]|nr:putative paraflagellar rod component par4 [Diplonema papillatum]
MSRRPSKPPGKKGKRGKEDLERQIREEDELRAVEETLQIERQAEEFERAECEERDQRDVREVKRLKREQNALVLAEKERCILLLSRQLNHQTKVFAQSRTELEDQLDTYARRKDTLENDLSSLKAESSQSITELDAHNRSLLADNKQLSEQLQSVTNERDSLAVELENKSAVLRRQVVVVEERLQEAEKTKDQRCSELATKVKNLERELEKTTALSMTLQEIVAQREADDKKNIALMQLLNNQLDESKQRGHNVLEAEKQKNRDLQVKLSELELTHAELQDETATLKLDKEQVLRKVEKDLLEYKSKLDQVKFDARFVHHELSKYKGKLEHQQKEFAKRSNDTTDETHKLKTDLETSLQKKDELEAIIRKKDRDHFDKVTFLNAQISNNRTAMAQIQAQLFKEKQAKGEEISTIAEELSIQNQKLAETQELLDKKKVASSDSEARFQADIAILKTTVFQLQSALVEKERELETALGEKEEEMRRLRRKLDENFIPHRRDGDGDGTSDGGEGMRRMDTLNDKLQTLTRDLEVRSRVALDTETRLNAQIAASNQVVESLQLELKAKEDQYRDTVKTLAADNRRLKATLEETFAPNAELS